MNIHEIQKERLKRGEDFQKEIRRSWRLIPNIWRMRITDGGAGTRPGDEIVLTAIGNFLVEMKRTAGDRFELSMLRPNQLHGLRDFDRALPHNIGFVFVSFLNEHIDEAYAIRLSTLEKSLKQRNHRYVTRKTLKESYVEVGAVSMPRIYYHDPANTKLSGPAYDLSEVVRKCQFL
ncbi:hypothetical protein SRRS_06960 [Sporomusa rhizae]|uniref:Holliday junction resolvase RecU n=1 Tax=Sporomusa rhizae TaxID=357999 RepID=UPI003529DB72